MKNLFPALLCVSLLIAPSAYAQDNQRLNQINLQANASEQVANDQLVATLLVQEQGHDPATLANMVNRKMAKLIDKAQTFKHVQYQTVNYNSRPIYKNGNITSWQVSQNIQLTSKDFEQLGQLVSQVNALSTVQSMQFHVSDQQIEQTQEKLTQHAIDAFKKKAQLIAKQFGKSNYHLVQVNIGNNYVQPPQHRVMRSAMAAESMDAAPALSAGTNKVTVNINGTIELF